MKMRKGKDADFVRVLRGVGCEVQLFTRGDILCMWDEEIDDVKNILEIYIKVLN